MEGKELFIKFEDIVNGNKENIEKELRQAAKRLSKITLKDMVMTGNIVESEINGVYVFLDGKKEIIYVGRCSSRSFIERIPSHLDPRKHAWFHSLLKAWLKRGKDNRQEETYENYKKALKNCFTNAYSVVLIQVEGHFGNIDDEAKRKSEKEKYREKTSAIEKYLKLLLNPKLNSYSAKYKNNKKNRIEGTLKEYLLKEQIL
ncbi:hypothetical protein J7L01_00735 [bacterium]|nr:hypothetical protein [bacterium]